ncbi:flagellar motor switch protein FliN [Buchnera aphidicola (Diuraphis noxia)]|uniref:Flagellar motor switch protein FliN n=1 Tax=Buchnera aphidicola subsp. Diuraphis noxia TaxID=118101 RepID=A0A1B2H7Z8_BUCDN|nr:flagellar motor switch protein FliN [Buchnera aphidicola]ANZ22324.1 flagellar motor switch protein FliN [Buchnera aphidicola (Diuraphis noxia)]
MSNIQKNSNHDISIDTKKDEFPRKRFNKNKTPQQDNKQDTLKDSQELLKNKDILLNTSIKITVELGKSKIKIKDFLNLSKGSMLILDKSIKEPLNIYLNGNLIARGEIVVLENKYGLRIMNIKNSLQTLKMSSEI